MNSLVEIYEKLLEEGASPSLIKIALAAYELGASRVDKSGNPPDIHPTKVDTTVDAGERRKTWDREYRARKRAEKSASVHPTEVESRVDTVDEAPAPASPLVPPLEVSPAPLPKTPPIIPPSPPPSPRGTAALRNDAVANRAKAQRFAEFRAIYPRRAGNQSWPASEKKYTAYVAAGVSEDALIDGARRYRASVESLKRNGTEFVLMASTWLNQKGWEDEYLAAAHEQSDLMGAFGRLRAQLNPDHGVRGEGGRDRSGWEDEASAGWSGPVIDGGD